MLGLGQRRAVVIIGRWLLPSLVDTGDICCHYWQHILVQSGHVLSTYFPSSVHKLTGLVQILAGHVNIFAGHVNFQNHVPDGDEHVNQMLNVKPSTGPPPIKQPQD